MKRSVALLAVLVLAVGMVAPGPALARGRHGGGWHGGGWWWPGALVGGLILGSAIAASHSYAYAYPTVVYSPPVVVTPYPATYAAPPAPVQREVVYPHGRYVLYGDGVTQAWQWVWVPLPPPGAPPAPPQ